MFVYADVFADAIGSDSSGIDLAERLVLLFRSRPGLFAFNCCLE